MNVGSDFYPILRLLLPQVCFPDPRSPMRSDVSTIAAERSRAVSLLFEGGHHSEGVYRGHGYRQDT